MSAENNKALVRRYVEEVLNRKNLAVVDELFAPTFVDLDSSMPEANGPAGIRRLAAMVHASFPDVHFTIEDMIAEGDKVVYRYSVSGTHKKDFMGIAATGRQISFTGIHIYRLGDGKLLEEWENWDALQLMRQLGVIP
jgi:steroid delta-isomerase-like uncharacterized protein